MWEFWRAGKDHGNNRLVPMQYLLANYGLRSQPIDAVDVEIASRDEGDSIATELVAFLPKPRGRLHFSCIWRHRAQMSTGAISECRMNQLLPPTGASSRASSIMPPRPNRKPSRRSRRETNLYPVRAMWRTALASQDSVTTTSAGISRFRNNALNAAILDSNPHVFK